MPVRLTATQQSGPQGFRVTLNKEQVVLKKNGQAIECRITAPSGVREKAEAIFKIAGQRGQEDRNCFSG